jgi:hypothetical protein
MNFRSNMEYPDCNFHKYWNELSMSNKEHFYVLCFITNGPCDGDVCVLMKIMAMLKRIDDQDKK